MDNKEEYSREENINNIKIELTKMSRTRTFDSGFSFFLDVFDINKEEIAEESFIEQYQILLAILLDLYQKCLFMEEYEICTIIDKVQKFNNRRVHKLIINDIEDEEIHLSNDFYYVTKQALLKNTTK